MLPLCGIHDRDLRLPARILRQKKPRLARQTRFFFLVCERDPFVKSGGYFSRVT